MIFPEFGLKLMLNTVKIFSILKTFEDNMVFGKLYEPCVIILRIYITKIYVITTERYIKN